MNWIIEIHRDAWMLCLPMLIALSLLSWLAQYKSFFGIFCLSWMALTWLMGFAPLDLMLAGETLTWSHPWFPALGMGLHFELTPFRYLFLQLVLGIGTMIVLYCYAYFHDAPKRYRFLKYLALFMMAMVGMVLSDHLLLIFLFWEITSVMSFLLVGFYHLNPASQTSARRALLVTGAGGLAMLTGVVMLGTFQGTYLLSEMTPAVKDLDAYPTIAILMILGAFTKSAQFPFHFWLPGAMTAPTPASAYLHSATMVKAGVFLLAILNPVMGGTSLWQGVLMSVGMVTFIYGAWSSLSCVDLKAILANTTCAVLGVLIFLIGVGTKESIFAMVIFLVAHALYKATLFMSAGNVDHTMGTRRLDQLPPLRKVMPYTATAAFLAAFSMAGAPLFFGFIGKEYIYKSILKIDGWLGTSLLVLLVLGFAMMMVSAYQAGVRPFFSWLKHPTIQRISQDGTPHEEHFLQGVPPIVLATLGVLWGTQPQLVSDLISSAATDIGGDGSKGVHLWQGFNMALVLSIVTVILGLGFAILRKSVRLTQSVPFGEGGFESGLKGCLKAFKVISHGFQFGTIRSNLWVIVSMTLVLMIWKVIRHGGLPNWNEFSEVSLLPVMYCVVMVLGALATVMAKQSTHALMAMSACGFGSSMLFITYGAMDLAITQIYVDVLISILFVAILIKLPPLISGGLKKQKCLDAILAGIFGLTLSLLTLKSISIQIAASISKELLVWSKVLAHGSNVVNVILVDFRAMNTLGEITVLCVAALGISIVARSKQKAKLDLESTIHDSELKKSDPTVLSIIDKVGPQ